MAIYTTILAGGTNNHETTSEVANAFATDFMSEGVVGSIDNSGGVAPATGGLAVNAQSTPDMTVAVSAGVCYIDATPASQGSQTLRVKSTAEETVTISANSSGSTKYDWIYMDVDATAAANPAVNGDDVSDLVTSRSTSSSTDDGTPPTYGILLAVVTVANGASSITNGNIDDRRTQSSLTATSNVLGWEVLSGTHSVATTYNAGNRSFTIDTSEDHTGTLSPGMRYRVTRNTTPPTQCADLEASSSHYASKSSPTGITFTDDFTCEAWVKLESYTKGWIVSRFSASAASGFGLNLESDGTIRIIGGSSSNYDFARSYQSVPLNKWIHIAATLDISGTTGKIYIDGVEVPSAYTNGSISAITNTGDIGVGVQGTTKTEFFDGKIADVRVWSDIRTATEIQDNMYAYPSDTTGLVAHFKLNGDFTDASSNGNDLTAQNSAVATNADNPWNATEYGIITAVSASNIQVFCPEGYGIPNETLTAPYYSTQSAPYGFPRDRGKWVVEALFRNQVASTSSTTLTEFGGGQYHLTTPIGSWTRTDNLPSFTSASAISFEWVITEDSVSGASVGTHSKYYQVYRTQSPAANTVFNAHNRSYSFTATSATTFKTWHAQTTGSTSGGVDGDNQLWSYVAELAYI